MHLSPRENARRALPHVRVWVPQAEDLPGHHAGLTAMLKRPEPLLAIAFEHRITTLEICPDEYVIDGIRALMLRAAEADMLDMSAVTRMCAQIKELTGLQALVAGPFQHDAARQLHVEVNRLQLAYDSHDAL